MPLAPHLVRRGAVYYWRRRLPRRLAACSNRRHVFMSLKTCSADRARALAAQLDAAFAEIAMLAETNFLSAPQLDAMLRDVIAAHSAKLDRIAAAGKTDPHFDAAEAARMDLRIGWAYRLLDAQGSSAVMRGEDRTAMFAAGFTDADVALVDQHLALLQANHMVPTPRGKLVALIERHGATPTPINLASAQQVYFRGLAMALFNSDYRYAGVVPGAAETVAMALRTDRSQVVTAAPPPPTLRQPPVNSTAEPPTAATAKIGDGIVAIGKKLVAKRAKDENWDSKGQSQASQIFGLMQRYMVEEFKFDGLADLHQHHLAAFVRFLESEVYKYYGKSLDDHTRTIAQLRQIASDKPEDLQGLDGGTLNRHIGKLDQLFDHARGQGIRIDPELNITTLRSRKKKKQDGRARNQRAKMLPGVMTRVFQAAPFTGCAAWDRPYEKGDLVFHRGLYFEPMLLAYTGTRREETCGLCVDDVFADAPVPYIHIGQNEFRRIKNPQSIRDIPLHPELLRLGFLEYVVLMKSLGYSRVFQDLYSPTSRSPLGDRFYDEFMPLLKWACKVEEVEIKFVLHSIRHGFNSQLKNALVSVEERADLMGHGGDSETSERYADPIMLGRALDVINRLPNVTEHLAPMPIQLLPWVERCKVAPFSRGRRGKKNA